MLSRKIIQFNHVPASSGSSVKHKNMKPASGNANI